MFKFAVKFKLPCYQRPYCYSDKVWNRVPNCRNFCVNRQLDYSHPRKIPSFCNGSCSWHYSLVSKVFFHSSSPRKALPPIVIVLMRPFTKFLAIVFGRTIRVWWRNLPQVKKEAYIKALKQRKYLVIALLTPLPVGATYFYITHIDETPITKRKRFIAFSNEQMTQLADIEQAVITDEHIQTILPAGHPTYCRVLRVVNRLLDSNKDVEGVKEHPWRVIVVDEPDVVNAFVLPNGSIFIYAGMLNLCNNDNELSIVLAHEMSHTILRHTAERMSNAQLVECLLFFPVVLIWALLPDLGAVLAQWFSGVIAKMLLHLPFSRQTEMEADDVGLTLAAKACFDVREAPCFWRKMKAMTAELEEFEWLSTHPSYDTRQFLLDELIPTALKLRDNCECPMLPSQDPRLHIDAMLKMITESQLLQKSMQPRE